MKRERVLILATSDIFRIGYNGTVPEGMTEAMVRCQIEGCDDYAGKMLPIVSTGLLEKAQERGFKVLVASTREETDLGLHDQWWIERVKRENVFCIDPDGEWNARISSGWKKALAAAGVEWPTNGQISPSVTGDSKNEKYRKQYDAEPAFWVSVQWNLQKFGLFGRDDLKDTNKNGD